MNSYDLNQVWSKVEGVERVLTFVNSQMGGWECENVIENARETLLDALEIIDKNR